ncbi:MAG: hypothetical protein OEX77_10260 [Candidatus Bathyarchaeota archaeon]|nr:hypothetical protein [Candidatus Bathyarchaeota archaeon]
MIQKYPLRVACVALNAQARKNVKAAEIQRESHIGANANYTHVYERRMLSIVVYVKNFHVTFTCHIMIPAKEYGEFFTEQASFFTEKK